MSESLHKMIANSGPAGFNGTLDFYWFLNGFEQIRAELNLWSRLLIIIHTSPSLLTVNFTYSKDSLTQNTLADSFFPDSVLKMQNFTHVHMDPHLLFTEAVTQSLLRIQGFTDAYSLGHHFPSFSLPVCFSGMMPIDSQTVGPDRHRSWWKWLIGYNKQSPPVTYFPFQVRRDFPS